MNLITWLRNQWDRVGAAVCIVAGAVLVLAGWLGASRTPYTVEQIPFVVSGGLGGLFLLGLGAMSWLSADLRDEWRMLHDIHATQLEILEAVQTPPGEAEWQSLVERATTQ
jgi:hypothetical protein